MRRLILGLGIAAAIAAPATARDVRAGELQLRNPTVKASLAGSPNTAGFLTVLNTGKRPDRLISASCACAAKVELHRMWMEGSVMRMRPAEGGFVIPAGGVMTLSESGNHMMLTGVKAPLKIGSSVAITLKFEHAGVVRVEFAVRGLPGAMAPMKM